ncbi:hypothetical protein IWQ56_003656 [Coemansia nantahalensis]|nr:hypothetical protein IWQ56_003656 [Coemansia nantahalensis]
MLRPTAADSVGDFGRYLGHLTSAYSRQCALRQSSDTVAQLQGVDSLDDATVDRVASELPEQSELGDSDNTGAELYLTATTVVQLLYQAGYLALVSKDRIGIPCKEAFDDLDEFNAQLSRDSNLDPNISTAAGQ